MEALHNVFNNFSGPSASLTKVESGVSGLVGQWIEFFPGGK